MLEPTERLLWLCAAVVVVGVAGVAVSAVGAAAPFCVAAIVVAVVADFFFAGSPAKLRIRRVVPETLIERKEARVGVVVESDSKVDVEITETLPLATTPWLTLSTTLSPGETATLTAPATFLRRGHHTAARLAVRTRGPLGLVRRRQRRVVDGEFAVGADLGALLQKAQRIVRGQDSSGGRKKRAIERGRELDSLREYRRGDDVRLVDWKASARKDGTGAALVVKEMVPETRQDVVVIVDGGRQLMGRHDDGSALDPLSAQGKEHAQHERRFDVAVHTALVLCAAALLKGDRAGIGAVQDDLVAWEPPREGKSSLKRVADAIADVSALPLEPAWQQLPTFLSVRLKRRALVCVVTDVVDEAAARALAHALAGLRGRHLVVVVALGDPALLRLARPDGGDGDPLGRFVPEAAQKLLQHRKRAVAALEASGALVVDAPAARAAALAVEAYLDLKSSGRL